MKRGKIVGWLCTGTGLAFLALSVLLVLLAMTYLPIGFSFGIGEMGSYATWLNKFTNLFWHVAPGLVLMGIGLVLQVFGFLILWFSRSLRIQTPARSASGEA